MIGPYGAKRPGDTLANALHVARLATGEAEETCVDTAKQKGGRARADALTAQDRSQIAKDARRQALGRRA